MLNKKILVVCTTDSMIWNFLIPHINYWMEKDIIVDIACSRTGFYFNELEEMFNGHVFEVPFERSPFKIQNLKALRQLQSLIKNNKYECVVSQEPVGGVIGRLAGVINHCKNIYTAHGFHFYKGAPFINWLCFYPIERFMSFFTDALITINEEDYQRAKTFHAKKTYKIDGIGINLEKFKYDAQNTKEIRNELGLQKDAYIVLTVAELIERKNYETALKTIHELKNENIVYLICGDGVLLEKLQELAKKYEIDDKVKFLGFRKDVYKFYSIANLFLFPSFQEGLSVALMEAMAAGLPIVCSDIRGNKDLIQSEKGGLLCNPKDYSGFSNGIKYLLENTDNTYGDFNKNYIKKFSIQNAQDQFYKIIEECLEL